ncbi:MAG: PHP domain-containing protein [Faecalimonas sp.]|nr:PHP domain-containing protein [Faecalimonas sp.]
MNFSNYKYKTELHLHTSPASPCSEIPPELAVKLYAELGYDAIVVTNHFFPEMPYVDNKQRCIDAFIANYKETVAAGEKYGLTAIFGCEFRVTENENDYLLFGIDENDLDMLYDCMPLDIGSFSKEFRREDRLLIQAHPFRNRMTQVPPEYLDGIETFNIHPNHNSRVALASKYAKEHHLIPTVGTDFHHPGHQGLSALLTETELKTSKDIVDVLRSGNYLFNISGSIVIP